MRRLCGQTSLRSADRLGALENASGCSKGTHGEWPPALFLPITSTPPVWLGYGGLPCVLAKTLALTLFFHNAKCHTTMSTFFGPLWPAQHERTGARCNAPRLRENSNKKYWPGLRLCARRPVPERGRQYACARTVRRYGVLFVCAAQRSDRGAERASSSLNFIAWMTSPRSACRVSSRDGGRSAKACCKIPASGRGAMLRMLSPLAVSSS